MVAREEFIQSLYDELERRRVSRDNPVHRRLIAGDFTREMLQEWGRQMWIWLRAFPGYLALLAGNAPTPEIRERLLTSAYEEETGKVSGSPPRIRQWEAVCAAFGLSPADLAASKPLPTTEAMMSTQELVARRSFVEGAAGLLVAVRGEAGPFMLERRRAMVEKYQLPESALPYFAAQAQADPVAESMALVAQFATTSEQQAAAREAVRRVLNARWEFFSGIGRAFGWNVP